MNPNNANSKTGKKPLYTKINKTARGLNHLGGGEYRHERHKKVQPEGNRKSMYRRDKCGYDYTPLYKFLLSKVGQDWTGVHSEAVARLDQEDPIFRMVAILEKDRQDIVHVSDFSYFSGLYVDENNILQKVNPNVGLNDIHVWCTCCTYTLNGIRVPRKEEKKTPTNEEYAE